MTMSVLSIPQLRVACVADAFSGARAQLLPQSLHSIAQRHHADPQLLGQPLPAVDPLALLALVIGEHGLAGLRVELLQAARETMGQLAGVGIGLRRRRDRIDVLVDGLPPALAAPQL